MTKLKRIPVLFNDLQHTYTNEETGESLKGITSTLIHRLFPDKYANIPQAVLEVAAKRGSNIHSELEMIESIGAEPTSVEGKNYIKLREQYAFKYLASEYTVSDLEHYATNIDVIYDVEDGVVDIADYKTTSKLDSESVSWQLSICAYFLELNNHDVKVRNLYGIWLRGDIAQVVPVERKSVDEVKALIAADIAGEDYVVESSIPSYIGDHADELVELGLQIQALTERYDALKAEMLKEMISRGDKSFDLGNVLITATAASSRMTFDSKKFQAEHEDMYKEYMKESKTKESIKVTIRK